ncbi:MAG: gliding motility-associated C-terminal domain-containing protein, partial [Lentimicrobiaceae bacterium]|nr:gliding motility-associated C-terminal domain-containing protein [Lentimicrobiaceae bacterium]
STSAAPCSDASDFMVLTINAQATAFAGDDATICEGSAYTISDAVATDAASILWTSNGTGSFDDATDQNPTYTPSAADRLNGSIILTMTVTSASPCVNAVDQMTLTISRQAVVNAGPDSQICEGQSFVTSFANAVNTESVLWTSNGTGSFVDSGLLETTYIPSSDDILNGSVVLTLTGISASPCPTDDDFMVLTINRQAIANAGPDDIICGGTPYTLSEASATNQYSVFWTTTGTGSFNSPYSINPTYTPSQNDIDDGAVTLIMTAFSVGACSTSVDEMILSIQAPVEVFAGNDAIICETGTFTLAEATSLNTIGLLWSTSGTGTFDNSAILNPVYTPSVADIASGSVILTLTGEAPVPCDVVTDELVLTISRQVIVNAGADASICEGTAYILEDATSQYAQSLLWTSSGTGFFNNPSLINPTYTPSQADIINGSVVLTLTGNPTSPCAIDIDQMILTISRQAVVNAGSDGYTCETAPFTITSATAAIYSSLQWTTSGTGEFVNPAVLNAVYQPSAADVAAGSVTLTLTAQSNAPCGEAIDAMTLFISDQAIADAGVDITICEGSQAVLSTAVAANATAILWTTSGTGLFSSVTVQNPVYTPSASDILNGSVILTMTVSSAAPCAGDADQMTLIINRQAIINAGVDAIICQGSDYTLTSSMAQNATSLFWTTSGTGTFSDDTILHPVYTPSVADISAGSVILTLTAQSDAPCGFDMDEMVLTISQQAVAYAGGDATICEGSSYYLESAVATSAASVFWTTTGTGYFNNPVLVNPTYFPSANDILDGNVTLTMYVNSDAPCDGSSDQMVLNISRQAEVNAGADAVICQGSVFMLDQASQSNASSILWTTSGSGVFSNPGILNPVYTPSSADISAGSVVLTLTAQSIAPCGSVSDAMVLNISLQATANAGVDASICEGSSYTLSTASVSNATQVTWSSNGSGSFNNVNLINATYTPSIADILNGNVTLTLTVSSEAPCAGDVDQMVLTISNQATVSAGEDASICEGSVYQLTNAMASDAASLHWTSSGSGTFDDANILNPVYTPSMADIISGNVTLTLTAQSVLCPPVSDAMVLSISRQATAYAGGDAAICEGSSYLLSNATVAFAQTVMWSTSGTGNFNNPSLVNATYTPSASDILNGTVTLTISVNAASPCAAVSDAMVLTISREAEVNAGADATICETETFTIFGAMQSNAVSLTWTSSGDGSFSDANILNPVYTPGLNDIISGNVTLTITGMSSEPCGVSTDQMRLFISRQATANAGEDATICMDDSYSVTGASATYQSSVQWSTSGTGSFNNANLMNPVYTPGVSDVLNGQVVLTMEAVSEAGCSTATDQMVLTIAQKATAYAGPDMTICQGNQLQLLAATASNYTSVYWTSDGEGSFINGNTLSPIYIPSATETGIVLLTLNVTGAEACGSELVTDNLKLTINAGVVANAGEDQSIAYNTTTILSGTAINGSGSYTYNWQPASLLLNSNSTNPETRPLTNHTEFVLLVTDVVTGCQDTDEVMVMIDGINYPPVAVDDYDTTRFNTSVVVHVTDNDSDPENDALSVSFCSYPENGLVVINSDNTITYTPYAGFAGDDSLCYRICDKGIPVMCDEAMIYIHVLPEPTIDDIVIYNGVSPNEDGNNDIWKIKGIEGFPDNTVKIFNRWGDKINEMSHYDNVNVYWDATNSKGEMVPDGTYYYILEIKDVKTFTGWIYVRSEN